MSANTERVRAGLEGMARGDLEPIVSRAHRDVEFVNPPYAIEPGTRHGIDGLRTGMSNMLDAFDELRFESVQLHEAGNRVVAIGTWTGRGRGSRYRFDPLPFAFVVTMRDGQMIRYEWFNEHAEALHAAGLEADTV